MFTRKTPAPKTGLETEIDHVLASMKTTDPGTEEYAELVKQLTKIHSLKTDESPKRMSPDTLATITANLAGILIIVGHERAHIVTSKALSFVQKLR